MLDERHDDIKKYLDRQIRKDDCPLCVQIRKDYSGFGPPHDASPRCESGKRNHCTCDICF